MRSSILALAIICGPTLGEVQAQPYPEPPMWDRGGNPEYRQDRRLPPRSYDPYDRGPERFGPQPPRGISSEEYERRAYCAMHPRACQ